MNRPSATKVRRTASDVSDQVRPHLASAKETLRDDVLPKVKEGAHAGLEATAPVRKKLRRRAGAAGAAAAASVANSKAHDKAADLADRGGKRKRGGKIRKLAFLAVVGGAAYAAYNAWKLPHDSDDWVHADSVPGQRTDGVPSGVASAAGTMGDKTPK